MELRGKLPDLIPLFRGHTATVLDTDWNPFDDSIIASSSDDGKIAIWKVPEDYKIIYEDPEEIKDIAPIKKLSGHSRKVGHIQWHPVAKDILASSSADYTVKIWNVESGEAIYTLPHKDLVTSFAFNHDGSLLVTACRDKKLRVWDIREEKIISEGAGHSGSKSVRVVWLGPYDRFVTTGFSRMSDRQYAVWDSTDVGKGPIGDFHVYDSSAGILVPFFDHDTNCLYLAGKGDGNIRYFEYENDQFFPLSEYQSTEPQRGLAFIPKRAVNVKEHEVVRIFKSVRDTAIEPISFIVPRRAETFQDDIYPPAYAGVYSLTAEEWVSGKNAPPKVSSLEAVFDGTSAEVVDGDTSKEIPKAKDVPPSPKPVKSTNTPSSPALSAVSKSAESPTPVRTDTPSKDIDGLLNGSKSVDKLLAKASSTEEEVPEPLKDEESSWADEPKEPIRKVKEEPKPVEKEVKAEEVKHVEKEVSAKEVKPVEKAPVKVEELKPSPAIKSTVTSTSSSSTASASASVNGNSSSSSDIVIKAVTSLEKKLEFLIDELKQRDERIESLEKKIVALLDRQD